MAMLSVEDEQLAHLTLRRLAETLPAGQVTGRGFVHALWAAVVLGRGFDLSRLKTLAQLQQAVKAGAEQWAERRDHQRFAVAFSLAPKVRGSSVLSDVPRPDDADQDVC